MFLPRDSRLSALALAFLMTVPGILVARDAPADPVETLEEILASGLLAERPNPVVLDFLVGTSRADGALGTRTAGAASGRDPGDGRIEVKRSTVAAAREAQEIPRGECPHLALSVEGPESDATSSTRCDEGEDLRICLTCGAVLCCESLGAHDRSHYEERGHPVIRPHRCDYDFLWCYECGAHLT